MESRDSLAGSGRRQPELSIPGAGGKARLGMLLLWCPVQCAGSGCTGLPLAPEMRFEMPLAPEMPLVMTPGVACCPSPGSARLRASALLTAWLGPGIMMHFGLPRLSPGAWPVSSASAVSVGIGADAHGDEGNPCQVHATRSHTSPPREHTWTQTQDFQLVDFCLGRMVRGSLLEGKGCGLAAGAGTPLRK